MTDVAVGVERAVRRGEGGHPDLRQTVEHDLPVSGITLNVTFQLTLGLGSERGDRTHLRDRRRTDRQVALQQFDPAHQVLRHEVPTQPPPGHRMELAHRAQHHRLARGLPGRRRRSAEPDAVVDLVRQQQHVVGLAPAGDRGELGGVDDRAGGVRRAGDDETVGLDVETLELLHRRLETLRRTAFEVEHVHAERMDGAAVGRVPGAGHRDRRAGVEGGHQQRAEPARAARTDDDLLGVDLHAVGAVVVVGDGGAQLEDALGLGVAERLGLHGLGDPAAHRFGCGGRRLPDTQHDRVAVRRVAPGGRGEQLHHVEGRHTPPLRQPCHQRYAGWLGHGASAGRSRE